MTPDQLDKLSQLIASRLRTLIWESAGANNRPFKPANLPRLFVNAEDIKIFVEGHLYSMGIVVEQPKRKARDR